jgi:hypothetical protein
LKLEQTKLRSLVAAGYSVQVIIAFMNNISEPITELGEALVTDVFPYPDVVCDFEKGIIPRGLIYEEDGRNQNGRTAVIVGINPGQAKPLETTEFKSKGCTYQVALELRAPFHPSPRRDRHPAALLLLDELKLMHDYYQFEA